MPSVLRADAIAKPSRLAVFPPARTIRCMQTIPDDPARRGAVAVVTRGPRFLVIRRSQAVVAPGAYCFPGGGIEEHESEEQALVREIREELGVTIEPIRRVWESVTPWKVRLSWWLSQMAPNATLTPNPAEVESVRWCTAGEMGALPDLLASNHAFLRALASGEVQLGAHF